MMLSIFHLLFIIMHCLSYATVTQLDVEKRRLYSDLRDSQQLVDSALESLIANYKTHIGDLSNTIIYYDTSYLATNPVYSIQMGWIDAASNWHTADTSDEGKLALEVTFKTHAQLSSISPTLAGKSLIFFVYNRDNPPVAIQKVSGLVDSSMISVGGYYCLNKVTRTVSGNTSAVNNSVSVASIATMSGETFSFGFDYIKPFSTCLDA